MADLTLLLTAALLVALAPLPRSRACVCLKPYADDLYHPVFMVHLPDKPWEFLVVEQPGRVIHFSGANKRTSKPFLDLKDTVTTGNTVGDERGLLGLALAPDDAASGRVYTYAVVSQDGSEHAEVTRHSRDGTRAVLLRIPQMTSSRNGGMLLFGEDKYLYIFLGDDGDGANSQNRSTFLGKALRIDVNGRNYSVPRSNPFHNDPDTLPEIYATGLMNPWRCSVDTGHPQTGQGHGRIICGDTGKADYDEINIVEKGGNYGWNLKEGNACVGGASACANITNEKVPVYVYNHTDRPAAVVGGYMYRGLEIPQLTNKYVFGETLSGSIMALTESAKGWSKQDVVVCPAERCDCQSRAGGQSHILAFAEDSESELFVLTVGELDPSKKTGRIFKLVPPLSSVDGDITTNEEEVTCSAMSSWQTEHRLVVFLAIVSYFQLAK